MAIADIDMSSCGKGALCLGYTLLKLGTNWLSFVENITVLLHHVNLSNLLNFAFLVIIKPLLHGFYQTFFVFI